MKIKSGLLAISLAMAMLSQSAHADPVSLINWGFENNWTSVGQTGSDGHVTFNYRPAGPDMGWTFTNGGGVAASYSYLHAYEGNRFALLQLASGFSQSFSLASASATTTLEFALALRPGYYAGQTVSVLVDGVEKAKFTPAGTSWSLMQADLGALTAGNHILAFKGNKAWDGHTDTTAFVDAVKLNVSPVPEPESAALFLAGLGLMGAVARRRKSARSS